MWDRCDLKYWRTGWNRQAVSHHFCGENIAARGFWLNLNRRNFFLLGTYQMLLFWLQSSSTRDGCGLTWVPELQFWAVRGQTRVYPGGSFDPTAVSGMRVQYCYIMILTLSKPSPSELAKRTPRKPGTQVFMPGGSQPRHLPAAALWEEAQVSTPCR